MTSGDVKSAQIIKNDLVNEWVISGLNRVLMN